MIDPMDIDPDTGQPYAGYSSPALDTSFHDAEMDLDSDSYCPSSPDHLHDWPRVEECQRCLCTYCGADGDA